MDIKVKSDKEIAKEIIQTTRRLVDGVEKFNNEHPSIDHTKSPEWVELFEYIQFWDMGRAEIKASNINQSNKIKAEKWDALDKVISAYYFDEDDNELEDEDGGDLLDIGEAAARAFGYM